MPKPAKIVLGILIGYVVLVVAFESMIGILQPEQGQVLTITTTGDDGVANDRVLAWLDDDGTVFVSANHWPRAWYNEAITNPNVEVSIDGEQGAYVAVPIEDAAEWERLDTKFAHPFLFKFITGFPPRLFLRLDPQGPTA
ncbi:MAG: nitroreductase family deazaflavin-dependent oxidoreductase [bacterium]|nr:nitroreductase family deazaflavin-dependent oxidoreductase [bacterium]